jgi:hypothetical protein
MKNLTAVFSSFAALAMSACGESKEIETPMTKISMGLYSGMGSLSLASFLTGNAPMQLASNLNLAAGLAVDEWSIKIDGCQSDYNPRAESTVANKIDSIVLFNLDEGCQAGLESFSFDGKKYVEKEGGVLTGEEGSKAIFQDAVSGNELKVTIDKQLASPLSDASRAQFLFFVNDLGDDAKYSDGINISANVGGVEAPNFEIFKGQYSKMSGGVPDWRIMFACQAPMVDGACPTPTGDPQQISSMTVRIVRDTYNGNPNYQDAEAVFAQDPGIQVVGDSTIGSNGGMVAHPIKGPGKLYVEKNLMVFIRFQRGEGASYKAFNFDIEAPTAN